MKLIYIDVETTGIPCPNSGLIQLAGLIEISGEVRESFDYRIRPFPDDAVSDEALAVNGLTREEIEEYEDPEAVFRAFINLLDGYVDRYDRADKFQFVAYNATFDADHLRAWFEKNGDKFYGSWFWHPPIDVMGLAAVMLMRRRAELVNFKLPSVAQTLGLDVDEGRAHDAQYDISLTREMFRLLREQIK